MIIQNLLLSSLARGGDKIAIEFGNKTFSFRDIDQQSEVLAQKLLEVKNIRSNRIGLLLDNKPDIIISMIACLKAGKCFVPLNRSWPSKRLESIIKQVNPSAIIGDAFSADIYDFGFNTEILEFDKSISSQLSEVDYPEYNVKDDIYIYFTSGSTGEPKGIIGRNESLLNYLQWEVKNFSIDSNHRFSQLISPYFDAFLRDVFIPITSNSILCIPDIDDLLTSRNLTKWIDRERISFIHCVPSMFRLINDKESLSSENFHHLEYVLMSGENIVPFELSRWYEIYSDRIKLFNLYGSTEATLISSYYEITPEDFDKNKIPIGKPIDNTSLLILNDDNEECSPLISGNLFISSSYLSNGYLNSELNKDTFIDLTTIKDFYSVSYKTGDLARRLPNGDIELLGRKDNQVKIRGIRVDLDEIDNILSTKELLKSSLSLLDDTNNRIITYVIPQSNEYEEANLEKHISEILALQLPLYSVPDEIIVVKEFPLLQNGKTDRKKLKKTRREKFDIVYPTNETEKLLVQIWKQILDVPEISVEEDFNKAGGNSLSMMRLIAKIYAGFNVRIPLNEIFNSLTIRKQANYILSTKKDTTNQLKRVEKKDFYNISASQERMFFDNFMNPESVAYNLPMLWKLSERVDRRRLEKILGELVKRHESLRATFHIRDNRCQQFINEPFIPKIEIVTSEVGRLNSDIDELIQPFNIEKGPLFRVFLIKLTEGDNRLLFDMHHIISDGASQIILAKDFLSLYKNQTLKNLEFDFKDYCEWENSYRKSEEYLKHRQFWLTNYENKIPSIRWENKKSLVSDSGELQELHFSISKEKLQPLFEKFVAGNKTNYSLFYTIYFIVLSKYLQQDDLVVGTNSSGRVHEEMSQVIGMFVKTPPIRFSVDYESSFNEMLEKLSQQLILAHQHQLFDLSDLISHLNKKRDNRITNLFDIMFVYQNFSLGKQSDQADFIYEHVLEKQTKFPLTFTISEEPDLFNMYFEYSASYFSGEDIFEMKELFINIIRSITDHSFVSISKLLSDILNGKTNKSSSTTNNFNFY
jgi:amino acid adenylation domain-containing protein